jgi:hypothetical protein
MPHLVTINLNFPKAKNSTFLILGIILYLSSAYLQILSPGAGILGEFLAMIVVVIAVIAQITEWDDSHKEKGDKPIVAKEKTNQKGVSEANESEVSRFDRNVSLTLVGTSLIITASSIAELSTYSNLSLFVLGLFTLGLIVLLYVYAKIIFPKSNFRELISW